MEIRLTDLEAPQFDLAADGPEVFLDRLRMQNSALDQLRDGLAAEERSVDAHATSLLRL